MAKFNGSLGQNKITFSSVTGALYNMIISQRFESKNIGSAMLKMYKDKIQDVGLYGDRILDYQTERLDVYDLVPDSTEACNVLKTFRPLPPHCEEMVVDTIKQIPVTLSAYVLKQGFSDERTYGTYIAIMEGWLQDTKELYLAKAYNAFVGRTKVADTSFSIDFAAIIKHEPTTTIDEEAYNRLQAQYIAKWVKDTLDAMCLDATTEWNEMSVERAYDYDDFDIIFNVDYLNKITSVDINSLFHQDDTLKTLTKNVIRLPGRYFGDLVEAGTTTEVKATAQSHIFVEPATINNVRYNIGAYVPSGTVIRTAAGVLNYQAQAVDTYQICKIVHKKAAPILTGFEVSTEFVNGRNLNSRNMYLSFMYSHFDRFTAYPWVSLAEA